MVQGRFVIVNAIMKLLALIMVITTSNRIVIRLLNSPLRGCEFLLSPGRTLLVVGQRAGMVADDRVPELPEETLFIPLEQGGVNFEILYEDPDAESVTLRELAEDGVSVHQRAVTFNNVLHVGALMFALRPEHQAWFAAVSEDSNVEMQAPAQPAKRYAFVTLGLLVVAVMLAGGFLLADNPQKQADQLGMLLGTDNQRFQVMPGRNKVMYVVAANNRDAIWAQQIIARGDYAEPAQVINPEQENSRVMRWLADNYPSLAYFRLQLDNPRQPQLWISRQRTALDHDAAQMLNSQLMGLLPYADRVDIVSMDDAVAVHQAESELKRQALPYSRVDSSGSVTFVIQGTLDDGELLRARRLVDDYYRQWGERYVQVAIELKDDRFKGYSFRYGEHGYIKMSPGHWSYTNSL